MKITSICATPLLVCLAVFLSGCQKNSASTLDADVSLPVSAATVQKAAPAAPAAKPGAAAAPVTVPAAFDFNTVAESTAAMPPFPYVDYPPKVPQAWQSTNASPMDEVYVILGKRLHRLEGRVQTSSFANSHAEMSELESRRNYENAIKAVGGVKVNTTGPEDATFIASTGKDPELEKKLRYPEAGLSYDVYLIRKGQARHWIAVMVNQRRTQVLSIEEKMLVQTVGYVDQGGKTKAVTATGSPAVAIQPVDLNAVAVSTAPLPPFPYIAYPPGVNEAHQSTHGAKFDAVSVIVGDRLQAIEGRLETRGFQNRDADMSQMALRRNYEAALAGLGAVKVSKVGPEDSALIAANGDEYAMRKKMGIPERNMSYDTYVIRTPQARAWVVLMFGDTRTQILTVEEKDFVQSVAMVTADKMRSELAARGRVALYLNFDTDKATIRADGKPAIDEIITLMKKDATLKLAVEGHTDNSGDARHNKELSQQRAAAVVEALVKASIDRARLSSSGLGDSRPLADNKDEEGRARNRRVELVRLGVR